MINIIITIIVTIIISIVFYYLEKILRCESPEFNYLNQNCNKFNQSPVQNILTENEKKELREDNKVLIEYIKSSIENYYKNDDSLKDKKDLLKNIASNITLIGSGKEEKLYSQIKKPTIFEYDSNLKFITELKYDEEITLNLGNNNLQIKLDLNKYKKEINNYNNKISYIVRENTYLSLGLQKLCIYYNAKQLEHKNPNTSTIINEKYSLKDLLELNEVGRVFSQLDLLVFVKNILEAVLVPQNWVNTLTQNQHYPYPLEIAHKIYNFPKNSNNGNSQKIAIVTYGKWFYHANDADPNFEYLIKEYKKAIKELNSNLKIKVATMPGYDSTFTPDKNQIERLKGAASEGLLDLGIILSCCPAISEVHIICMGNYSSDEKHMVHYADSNNVHVLSISWGSDSSRHDDIDKYISDGDKYKNLTICVASGDHGGLGNDQSKPNNTLDPASSQYVLSCGGTEAKNLKNFQFATSEYMNAMYQQDHAWTGSGGGISSISRPNYQTNYFKKYTHNLDFINSNNNRLVPDISGMAQSNWLIPVQFNDPDSDQDFKNRFSLSGGTSAVAPLYASLFVVVNQERKKTNKIPIGFVNPILYELADNNNNYNNYFIDITNGKTKGEHSAEAKYDLATGLGVLKFDKIINYLKNYQKQ